jgi:hypothetical protein
MAKAVSHLSGHKIGHSEEIVSEAQTDEEAVNITNKEVKWCARRDSNSRPNAPEAFALSS